MADEPSESDKKGYSETSFERSCVRCCGATTFVLVGLLVLSWVAHAIPIVSVNDAPSFARSLLWSSIAHHTKSYGEWKDAISPPPPSFGDGAGNF